MKEKRHASKEREIPSNGQQEHSGDEGLRLPAGTGGSGLVESGAQVGREDPAKEDIIRRSPETASNEANLTPVTHPGLINETNIRAALIEAKGDLYVAACLLEISAPKLDRLIRCDSGLQAFAAAVETVKADADYERMSQAQFAAELHRLTGQYAVEGLLVVHEIAVAPATTAAEKAVKLEAALALRNGSSIARGGSEIDQLLRELNHAYQSHAPRIKEIRTTTVVLEDSRQSESSTLTVEPSRD